MILPDSFKNSNKTNDEKNYEYKFKRNGTIVQKPTDLGHIFATIKQNRALKGLKGVDDYSGFTTKGKRNSLIYQFDNQKRHL